MSIRSVVVGDVTSSSLNIIIGMNTRLGEASALGRQVLSDKSLTRELDLGEVITFDFGLNRRLHMVVCHYLGQGGWMNAEKYLRFGLDYLWQTTKPAQEFAIVQIGMGVVGRRDGADDEALRTAMATSHLPLHLYIRGEAKQAEAHASVVPLRPLRTWSPIRGEQEIRLAA